MLFILMQVISHSIAIATYTISAPIIAVLIYIPINAIMIIPSFNFI